MALKITPDDDDLDAALDEAEELLPDRLLSGFELEALVRTLKRQQESAVKQVDNQGGPAKLFEVRERWAASHLRHDAAIKVIEDSFAFELSMRDPDIKIVLVDREHGMDPEQLRRLCQRAPKNKTIFLDVSR